MRVISDCADYASDKKSIITLGKFDGIHRGHQKLFKYMRTHRRDDENIVAFTFDFSIRSVLTGSRAQYLFDDAEKRELLRKQGVDVLVECPFDDSVRCMKPEDFVRQYLVDKLHVSKIVIGDDFRFGHNREGDSRLLSELSDKYGYEFYRIEKEREDGVEISSTYIRSALSEGNIELVNSLLGFDYFCEGSVVHGNHIGADLGSPTINQTFDEVKLLPPYGVYFSKCIIGGREYPAISNIGIKPTVGENNAVGIESFLLEYSGDLYDKEVKTCLYHYRRPEKKFKDFDELKHAIEEDTRAAKEYWKLGC
ncbi:MAG: bifunctional riboflavin kinase/FAD synthetase [Lachnospiraceae bacterium]|nr:bifunctional riboflavin kinase/FAD synthetase [Lachnospiraceae bacterium]